MWRKLLPAVRSIELRGLPLGLAAGARLLRPVKAGQPVRRTDVALDETLPAVRIRREMEAMFAPPQARAPGLLAATR